MPRQSTVLALGADIRARVEQLLEAGVPIRQIVDQINTVLAEAGRPERVSRAALGRAAQRALPVLAAKKRADRIVEALGTAGAGDLPGRLELLRALLTGCAVRMAEAEDAVAISDLREIASAMLTVEKTAHLADLRAARAEARAAAGRAGEQAARRQGLSVDGAAAIRAAIEGADA